MDNVYFGNTLVKGHADLDRLLGGIPPGGAGASLAEYLLHAIKPDAEYNAVALESTLGMGGDDAVALQSAIDHVHALGGGRLVIDRTVRIGSNLTCPRTVALWGVGAQRAQIVGIGGFHTISITGVPSDSPNFAGDKHVIGHLTFDAVGLRYAPNSGDVARGCQTVFCDFVHCDVAIYYGHAFFGGVGPLFCNFLLCGSGIYFDLAAAVVGAGAHLLVTGCIFGETDLCVVVNGSTLDGIALYITDTYADHVRRFYRSVNGGEGGVYIKGWGVELCGLGPEDVPFDDGYFIENDGNTIFVDGIHGFAHPSHTDAILWNKAGNIYVEVGRDNWEPGQFCRIDSGLIIVDQSKIFSSGRLWGEGSAPFAHASSSGGKVVAPRSAFVGTQYLDPPELTTAAPTYAGLRAGEAYDGNDRVWEFDLRSNGAANNAFRVHLADGAHLVRVDLNFPANLAGGGHVKVVHRAGYRLHVSCTYMANAAGTVAGAAGDPPTNTEFNALVTAFNTQRGIYLSGSVADNNTLASTKFLLLTTLGSPASTMTITNIVETISGPKTVGT